MKIFFRAKIHAQAQRVKSAGRRGNLQEETSEDEDDDESDVPTQVQRWKWQVLC